MMRLCNNTLKWNSQMTSADIQNQCENAIFSTGDNKNILSDAFNTLARSRVRFVIGVCSAVVVFALCVAQAEPTDDWVKDYVVQIVWGSEQTSAGAGVYLGEGLVVTAAHVGGPQTRGIQIDGLNVPAKRIKAGTVPELDLALISMDEEKLPADLRSRHMPLCQEQLPVGAPVVIAAHTGITRSSIATPLLLPPEYRTKFSTLITEGATDGKSGSGVFDAEKKCLLGILALKFSNGPEHKGIASYFVPASAIRLFVSTAIRR